MKSETFKSNTNEKDTGYNEESRNVPEKVGCCRFLPECLKNYPTDLE